MERVLAIGGQKNCRRGITLSSERDSCWTIPKSGVWMALKRNSKKSCKISICFGESNTKHYKSSLVSVIYVVYTMSLLNRRYGRWQTKRQSSI